MKRTLIALTLACVAGVGAHYGWFLSHRPKHADTLDSRLEWMKHDLRLTDAQLLRIRALHEQSSPRLAALAREVARMEREFASFERARQDVGQVDFLEFARFVEKQRMLDRECATSTRQLVAATADVLTPGQREQYLSLLGSSLRQSDPGVPR